MFTNITGFFRRQKTKQKAQQPLLLAATGKSLRRLRPGMYWFTDNTFSDEMIPNKMPYAIVLKASFGKVVGLALLKETAISSEDCLGKNSAVVLDDNFYLKLSLRRPKTTDLKTVSLFLACLNQSLSVVNFPLLGGVYRVWGRFRTSLSAVYDVSSGKKIKQYDEAAVKTFYVFELKLK